MEQRKIQRNQKLCMWNGIYDLIENVSKGHLSNIKTPVLNEHISHPAPDFCILPSNERAKPSWRSGLSMSGGRDIENILGTSPCEKKEVFFLKKPRLKGHII